MYALINKAQLKICLEISENPQTACFRLKTGHFCIQIASNRQRNFRYLHLYTKRSDISLSISAFLTHFWYMHHYLGFAHWCMHHNAEEYGNNKAIIIIITFSCRMGSSQKRKWFKNTNYLLEVHRPATVMNLILFMMNYSTSFIILINYIRNYTSKIIH